MTTGKVILISFFGILLILSALILIQFSQKAYITKDFNRDIFGSDMQTIALTDSDNLIISSSQIDVKYIHSGNLKVKLSNPLNLKHPACKDLQDEEIQVPINAYLIHHKQYGYFLIDSGSDASYLDNPYGHMNGFLVPFFVPKTELVQQNAIENQIPAEVLKEIKGVFFTHLHSDHTAGLPALPGNLIYIAGKGEKSYAAEWFIDFNHFSRSDTMFMLDFTTDYAKTFPIGKAIDIFGDQTVWAISTPGHSNGHVSYLINREDNPVFIAGDACILNKNLELGVGSGTSAADSDQDQETLNKIRAFIESNQNVEVWCGHDFPKSIEPAYRITLQ